jgi:hypothetical protein
MNRHRFPIPTVCLAAAALAVLGSCGSGARDASTSPSRTGAAAESPASARSPWAPPTIDPANFVARVTNPYLPLVPGTTLHYRGVMKDGTTPQVDSFAVTHQRRLVMGIPCTVVRDTVTSRGGPVERTYDWFAQDRQGNVWYMGEETQELKHGRFGKMIDSGPAGKNGAQPGVMMEAHPVKGDSYWQFHWPGHAMDTAIVRGSGGRVKLPYRSFEHTLLTQEQSPLEPGVRDQKWSVRGIGYVQERAASGTQERIKLVGVTHRVAGPIESGAGPGWPVTLSPGDFVTGVDNPWFPLRPGSEYRYIGLKDKVKTVDVVKVTDKTKRILGVATTVVHDVVRVNGRPEEETNDYYAQDRQGNVWYFGEATKTLNSQGKTVSTEGSFQAGVNGERAGVLIPGHPHVGQVARQEFSKGEAEDHFKVLDLNARVSVPFVSTRHALRTREWTPLEPGVVDNKYYVRGIGTVREIAVKGPVERLRLVSYKKG